MIFVLTTASAGTSHSRVLQVEGVEFFRDLYAGTNIGVATLAHIPPSTLAWGPIDHVNMRTLHSGSKAQDKGGSRNQFLASATRVQHAASASAAQVGCTSAAPGSEGSRKIRHAK